MAHRNAGALQQGVITHNILRDLTARAVARVAPHTVPWIVGAGMIPVGAITHELWGDPGVLPWATAGIALSGAALTGITWAVSRYRRLLGRLQSTGTTAVASGWLLAATITGPTARPTLDIGLWLGGTLAAAWNIRTIIRSNPGDGDEHDGRALFRKLIQGTAEKAGVGVKGVKEVRIEPHRVSGRVELDGATVDDLQRAIPAMEARARLPHGALVATPTPADAGAPTIVLSDPTLLDKPIPWPGPSRPGGSVADPLRIGVYQDGTTAELRIPGSHLQIMGMTGSGKTTGGAWTIWGELVTRPDSCLIVVDITKGLQSVGPARPALHRVITDRGEAQAFFRDLGAVLRERTDYLASRGMIKWAPGCGLSYLVIWLEEAADVFEHIDMEAFINLARALRSAGGTIVWSLQRADHTQMPTIVKGQGGAYLCFGVANSHDARWGISAEQEDAGAKPERWRNTKPGMCYLDAPGVAPERIAIPLRVFDWGRDDDERVARFAEHCAAYPADARPVDPITAKLLAHNAPVAPVAQSDDLGVGDVVHEYLAPDPELDGGVVDVNAPLGDAPDLPLGGNRMGSEQARAVLDEALARFGDGRPFAPRDLGHVLSTTGMSRAWIQKQLRSLVEAGRLEHDPGSGTYRVRAPETA